MNISALKMNLGEYQGRVLSYSGAQFLFVGSISEQAATALFQEGYVVPCPFAGYYDANSFMYAVRTQIASNIAVPVLLNSDGVFIIPSVSCLGISALQLNTAAGVKENPFSYAKMRASARGVAVSGTKYSYSLYETKYGDVCRVKSSSVFGVFDFLRQEAGLQGAELMQEMAQLGAASAGDAYAHEIYFRADWSYHILKKERGKKA